MISVKNRVFTRIFATVLFALAALSFISTPQAEAAGVEVIPHIPVFTVGQQQQYSVETIANDDAGKMVRAYFVTPAEATVEYYETFNGINTWLPLPNEYGPAEGFPLANATSDFRATFDTAGTYTVTVDFKEVGGDVVKTVDLTFVVKPELTAEEFVAVDGSYKGISVGFRTKGFGTATAVEVALTREDGSVVTKTANQGVIDIINNDGVDGDQLTAPFVIQEGGFTEAGDTLYWNPAPASWNTHTRPVEVTITVTDENGDTTVINDVFNDGDPSWPTYESLLSPASCDGSTFDSFIVGSVDGQDGWSATGPYDQAIEHNTYGFDSFGCKVLRVSNAKTSGSFGDWIFSPSTINEAGEASSTNNGFSGGIRQNRFEAEFDIASTNALEQTDLQVSVSPDRGDGARMSYLRFADASDGIHVYFDDYTNGAFNETDIATLDRSQSHTIKMIIDFVDGAANDIVEVYVDGDLKITGTTWEDYFRENQAEVVTATVDSLLIQARNNQATAPDTLGEGFIFDNVSIATMATPVVPPTPPSNNGGGGGGSKISLSDEIEEVEEIDETATSTTDGGTGQVLGASSTPVVYYTFLVDFGYGTENLDVTNLQTILIAAGYLDIPAPTGFFGPLTFAAVQQYQAAYGIPTTGFVGPLTRAQLNITPVIEGMTIEQQIAIILARIAELQAEANEEN